MNIVIQQEKTGCAIASAAFIAGISYQQAKETASALGIYSTDTALWSETNYIHSLLDKLNHQATDETVTFKDWDSLPDLALLSINHYIEDNKAFWHWVVFVREDDNSYVHDSSPSVKNHQRTDFDQMNPHWFIAVTPKRKT